MEMDHVVQNGDDEVVVGSPVKNGLLMTHKSMENGIMTTTTRPIQNNYKIISNHFEDPHTTFWMDDSTLAMSTFYGDDDDTDHNPPSDQKLDNDSIMELTPYHFEGQEGHGAEDPFENFWPNEKLFQPIQIMEGTKCTEKIGSSSSPKILSKLLSNDATPSITIGVNEKIQPTGRDSSSLDGAKLFECLICKKSYDKPSRLSHHLLTCHTKKGPPIQCPSCSQKCLDSTDLLTHTASHLSQNFLKKCDYCQRSFYSASGLTRHKKICGGGHLTRPNEDAKIVPKKKANVSKFKEGVSQSKKFLRPTKPTPVPLFGPSSHLGHSSMNVTCPFCLGILADEFLLRQHIAVFHPLPPLQMSMPLPVPLPPPCFPINDCGVSECGGGNFLNFYDYFM